MWAQAGGFENLFDFIAPITEEPSPTLPMNTTLIDAASAAHTIQFQSGRLGIVRGGDTTDFTIVAPGGDYVTGFAVSNADMYALLTGHCVWSVDRLAQLDIWLSNTYTLRIFTMDMNSYMIPLSDADSTFLVNTI